MIALILEIRKQTFLREVNQMVENQSGTETTNAQGTGFSEDYVKTLREEAASWRTKFR